MSDDLSSQVRMIFKRILKDVQVELKDEFDRNFERETFFTKAWARRRSPFKKGEHLLSGIRSKVRSQTTDNSIRFYVDHSAAAVHNEGCEITVTEKMKTFFWWKYYTTVGSFGRKKDGSKRNNKRNHQLSDEADFWKAMALKKVGSKIIIPQRQFLGTSPEVEAAVRQIIEDNLTEYIKEIDFSIL